MIKLTPSNWENILGFHVIDPDGWDRKNFEADWQIPLSFDEFMDKAAESTTTHYPSRDTLRRVARCNI